MFSIVEYESFLHTEEFRDQILRVLDEPKVFLFPLVSFCYAVYIPSRFLIFTFLYRSLLYWWVASLISRTLEK